MARIALIESELSTSNQYREWIQKALPDAQVDQFFTRDKAEAAVVNEHYDLVVLDISFDRQLHGGISIAVLMGSVRPTPILVVSGHQASTYRGVMMELGAWNYLQKPMFVESEFIKMVLDILREPKSHAATD